MKTVSTKLDSKSHEYLIDLANKNGTTVSDVLRDMVDGLIQNEDISNKTSSDRRRNEMIRLESEMSHLDDLLTNDISEQNRRCHVVQYNQLENKLSDLLDEERDMLETSLLNMLNHKSWFYSGDKFLDYVETYDIPLLDALNSAMECYLENMELQNSEMGKPPFLQQVKN